MGKSVRGTTSNDPWLSAIKDDISTPTATPTATAATPSASKKSSAPASDPWLSAVSDDLKKKVGTTDGSNGSTTSAPSPSSSEAQSPSTTDATGGQTLGNSTTSQQVAPTPETFVPSTHSYVDQLLGKINNSSVRGDMAALPGVTAPANTAKSDEVVAKRNEAITNTALENLKRKRGVYDKKLPPPTKDEINTEKEAVTQAYNNNDIAPVKEGDKIVMKRTTGFAETALKGINEAYKADQENNYFASLSQDEKIRYLNTKQQAPDAFDQPDNSTTVGSKVDLSFGLTHDGINVDLGEFGKAINNVAGFGGENAGMLAKGAVGAVAMTEAAPIAAASSFGLIGTAGAGNFGSFLALANQFGKGGYTNLYQKTYYALKKQGLSDQEAADKANTAGLRGEMTQLGVVAALSTNIGSTTLPEAGIKTEFNVSGPPVDAAVKGLTKLIDNYVAPVANNEFVKMAGSSAAASLAESEAQSQAGVKLKTEDVLKDAVNKGGEGLITAFSFWGLHKAAQIATSVPSYIRPLMENLAASTPVEAREAYLNKAVEQGVMTEEEKVKISKTVNQFGETKPAVNDLPIPEEKKAAITGKLVQVKKLEEQRDNLSKYGSSFNDKISQIDAQISNIHEDINKMYGADDVFEHESDSLTGEKPTTAPAVVMPNEVNKPTTETTIAPDETLKPDIKDAGAAVIIPKSNTEPNIVSLNGENQTATTTGDSTGQATDLAQESEALTSNESPTPQEAVVAPAEIKPTVNESQAQSTEKPQQQGNEPIASNNESVTSKEESSTAANASEDKQAAKQEIKNYNNRDEPISTDEIGSGFVLHRGSEKTKKIGEGFYSLDKDSAEGYANGTDNVVSAVIKPTANVLKLVEGTTDDYSPSDANVDKFYEIIGEKERNKNTTSDDHSDITEVLWGNKKAVKKLKEAGIDVVVGNSMDGVTTFVVNKDAIQDVNSVTSKTKENAIVSSEVQQQEVPKSSSEQEHARTSQEQNTEATKAADSNSNLGSEGKPKTKVSRTKASGSLRNLSSKIREEGLLPNWAKADLPEGTKSQGFGGKSLDEAVARSLELVADAIDAGKGLADSVNEGFAHIKDYYEKNTKSFDEKKLKTQFRDNIKKQLQSSGELSGITHAETEATRKEFGLGDSYEKTPRTDNELRASAVEEIKNGYNIEKLVSDVEKGKIPSDKETTILKIHKANLEAAIEKNPSDENLAQLRRLVKASDAAGSEQGRALRSRQGLEIRDDSLAGFFTREQDIHGDEPLTEEQKKQVVKEHTEISEAQKKYEEKIAALEKENARLKAAKKVQNEAAKVTTNGKKTKEDFVKERKDIIQNIRDKWKNAAKDNMLTAVPVPYAKQLAAIAPDVAKLVRSLVEEGVTKLADVTKNIHNTLKEDFPEISEKDVHDIIAGEYGEKKKPTKNDILQKVADLRTQSQLINKLEELRKGPIPKTEKERIARSKEIEDLRQQIKDKETEYADAKGQFTDEYKKLETERNRQLKRVGELKEKLATLQSGKLPEGDKREAKVDVPEIEALKKDIEVAEKEVRKNLAQQERMKDLESELQRIKDRKAKDPKPENKRAIGEEEKKVRDAIEAEREKWNRENRMTDLQGELQRLKDRKDKTTDPKAKRAIGDDEQKVRDDISKEKRIIGLEKELQRLKDRRTKDKTSPDTVSPEEQKLADEIKSEREKWRKERSSETSLSSIKSRTKSEIEKLKQQLTSGNFEKEQNQPVKLDQEAIDLKDKLIKLRKERESRIIHEEYKKRTKWEKFKDGFSEVIGVPRTLMSSLDYSAPLRQALIATVAHPKIAASAGLEMFKQGFSQKRFDRWFYDVKESPRYKLMEQSGLYVADPHDPRMTAREESFMSNLGEKVPLIGETLKFKIGDKNVKIPGAGLVRGSERAYVSYLNKMRVDLFNRMVDDFEAQGSSFEKDPKLFKDLANFVNNSTGRGNLGFAESAGPVLSSTFFSPRLIASRLSLLRDVATFGNFGKMHPEVRKVMYKDMLAFIGTGLSVLALVKASNWAVNCKDENGQPCVTIEADPRSSDFGKIKSGNMRWDIWGGFQQYIRVITQLVSGESKSSSSGQVQELDGKGQFGKTRLDQATSFVRGKLAPTPSMIVDVLGGRTATGDRVTLKDEAVGHLLPLIASDLKDAMQDKGVKAIFTMGIPSTFGVGVSTYLPRGYENKDIKKDPVYSFLYKKSMAIAPPTLDNVPENKKSAFISKRDEIFKSEWHNIIKYGGLIDENGHATTDMKKAVKRIDTDKLDREDLSDLMRSISTKSTRAAEKALDIKVGRQAKIRP